MTVTTLTLYAITDAKPKALGAGLRGVKIGKAWVVVARAPKPAATPDSLRAYDRVVRRIARAVPSLLPFRFGSVARDEEELAELLAPFGTSIARALDRTRGCVQFTLRVHGEPAKKRKTRTSGGPGTRWLEARREALRVPEIDPVTERTAALVRETRSERDRHEAGDHLATVYHLVERRNVGAWRAAVDDGSTLLDRVTIKTSGPWPPYAFAELP